MTVFTIDFFDRNQHLGGTEADTTKEKAICFAFEGLTRHDASWARVLEHETRFEKRLCARALRSGHGLEDHRVCGQDHACVPCPTRGGSSSSQARK